MNLTTSIRLAGDEHSSLIDRSIKDEDNSYVTLTSRGECYDTYFWGKGKLT